MLGDTWVVRETNRQWRSIAASSDGTKLLAAANSGQLYVSSDAGATWIAKSVSGAWRAVAMSADGVTQAAVMYNGKIYISNNSGNTWSAYESNRTWVDVAISGDGQIIVASTANGLTYASSNGGSLWASKPYAGQRVALSYSGQKQIGLGSNIESFVAGWIKVSNDYGDTWANKHASRVYTCVSISSDGTKAIIVDADGGVYVTANGGDTWSEDNPVSLSTSVESVAMSGNGTLAAFVATSHPIYLAPDGGVTWAAKESARAWKDIAFSGDGTTLAAVVDGGQIYLSGGPPTPAELSGAASCIVTTAGNLSLTQSLSGAASCVTTATGEFFPLLPLSGVVACVATAAGQLATMSSSVADITLPALTLAAFGGGRARLILPCLTLAATGTSGWGLAHLTLPALTLAGTGHAVHSGAGAVTLPRLTLAAQGGGVARLTLPALTLAASASQQVIGRARLTLPALTLAATGYRAAAGGTAHLTLPMFRPLYGRARLTLPMIFLQGRGSVPDAAIPAGRIDASTSYLLNVATNGITEYTNYGYLQVVRCFGAYYGLRADGLYLLSGDTDQIPGSVTTQPIACEIETHPTDYANPDARVNPADYLKRLPYVYVQHTGRFAVTSIIEDSAHGPYEAAGTGLPRRVRLARGPSGRHHAVRLKNVEGDKFCLTSLELAPELTSRKV